MSEHWIDRLSDYIDGDLTPDERAACEAHVGVCAECRMVLAELQSVVTVARQDPERRPAAELWPGIASRLDAPDGQTRVVEFRQPGVPDARSVRDGVVSGAERRLEARRISFSLAQLALAASVLIAVSAGVSWVVAKRPVSSNLPSEPMVFAVSEAFAPVSPEVKLANFADAQFDAAIADLEHILEEQRDMLDPRTVRVLERNLQAIDEAIRQSRQALEADPANPFLNSHLADARQRKLELLRRAALLTEGGD